MEVNKKPPLTGWFFVAHFSTLHSLLFTIHPLFSTPYSLLSTLHLSLFPLPFLFTLYLLLSTLYSDFPSHLFFYSPLSTSLSTPLPRSLLGRGVDNYLSLYKGV
jgi:hypothetical protein